MQGHTVARHPLLVFCARRGKNPPNFDWTDHIRGRGGATTGSCASLSRVQRRLRLPRTGGCGASVGSLAWNAAPPGGCGTVSTRVRSRKEPAAAARRSVRLKQGLVKDVQSMARRLRQKEPTGAARPGALSSERALQAPEGALNPPLFECVWRRPTELTHARSAGRVGGLHLEV